MSVSSQLSRAKRVFLDTAVLIYFGEQHPVFSAVARKVFAQAIENNVELIIGPITVAECFAGIEAPDQASNLASLLFESDEVTFHPLSKNAAVSAGRLRRERGLPLADALQVAQALEFKCDLIISNDVQLSTRQSEMPILLLSAFESGS